MATSSIKGAAETVKEVRQEIQTAGGDSGITIGESIGLILGGLNDLSDPLVEILDLSGVGALIPIALNLLLIGYLVLMKLSQGDIKSLFRFGTILNLITENIPVIGAIWPGWIFQFLPESMLKSLPGGSFLAKFLGKGKKRG